MEIRPAFEADVPRVLPMVVRVCDFHERLDPAKYAFSPDIAAKYDAWLRCRATDDRSVFLVADAGRSGAEPPALAGFLVGTVEKEIPIYRLAEFAFIHDLWIEPPYRHEGLARSMVSLAIERFAAIGIRQIRMDVAAGNEPALRLFEACGFKPSTIEHLLELR